MNLSDIFSSLLGTTGNSLLGSTSSTCPTSGSSNLLTGLWDQLANTLGNSGIVSTVTDAVTNVASTATNTAATAATAATDTANGLVSFFTGTTGCLTQLGALFSMLLKLFVK
jgi:hypothetical protein